MTATAYELATRREFTDGENPSARTTWQVNGATSYANARAALDAAIPSTFTFPSGVVAYLDKIDASEMLDDAFFEFTLDYQTQPQKSENQTEFEFDVSAATDLIYQSYATSTYVISGSTAPDFQGAVGVQFGSSQPRGIAPHKPFSTFTITKHWAVSSVTQTYQLAVEALVGVVSSATFNGRAAGTVRFLGARGRQSGDKFPISYEFGFRPNVSACTAGGITVGAANGWDLLEYLYRPYKHAAAKQVVWRPHAAYVHRVHPLTSLAGLAL